MVRILCIVACVLAILGAGGVYGLIAYQCEQEKNRQLVLQLKQQDEQTKREKQALDAQERQREFEKARLKQDIVTAVAAREHESKLAAERERAEIERVRIKAQADSAARIEEAKVAVELAMQRERALVAADTKMRETERQERIESAKRKAAEQAAQRAQREREAREDAVLYKTLQQIDKAEKRCVELAAEREECDAQAEKIGVQMRALKNITTVNKKDTKRLERNIANLEIERQQLLLRSLHSNFKWDNIDNIIKEHERLFGVETEFGLCSDRMTQHEQELQALQQKMKSADSEYSYLQSQLVDLYLRPEMRKAGAVEPKR